MEKVIFQTCQKVPGKMFYTALLADGRNATIWDETIAQNIQANLGVEANSDVVPFAGKNGKSGGFNIRSFVPPVSTQSPVVGGSVEDVSNASNTPQPSAPGAALYSQKDASIISQCLTKCATKLLCPRITERTTISEMDSMADNALSLAVRMYKNCLYLIEDE